MSFLSSPHRGGVAPRLTFVSFGDAAVDPRAIVSTSSLTGSDAVSYLQRQINRYTQAGGAPIQFRIGADQVPVTGTLDDVTATRAVWIMQMRAGMANIAWNDGASAALLNEAMGAWGNPRAFVTKNMNKVIDVIRLFGDKNGVPPAPSIAGLTPTVIAAGVTAIALAFIYTRRGR